MNRPIVSRPLQAPETSASSSGSTPNGPVADIATPTQVGTTTSTTDADLLGITATLRAAGATSATSGPPGSGTTAGATALADSATAPETGAIDPAALAAVQSAPRRSGAPGVGGFRIGLAQIVSWQLAVVVVAIGYRLGLIGIVGGVAVALALVALTTVRIRGTWLHQWIAIAVRFWLRQRDAELPETGDAMVALLEPWLGTTTIGVTVVRDRPLALISHRAAVGALVRLDPADGGAGIRSALGGLLEAGTGTGPGIGLDALDERPVDVEAQLVIHGGLRTDMPRGWIAVAAHRSVDLSTDDQLAMVVKNAVRRIQRQLERAGSAAVPVDDREAATTVTALAHAGAGRGHVRERWSTWSAGPVGQTCLRLVGFTRLPPGTAETLVDTLVSTATDAAVTIAVASRAAAGAGTVDRRDPVVRIAAASPGALDVAVTVLGRLARMYRVHPERLDGRHGPGMAASLPIARSLR